MNLHLESELCSSIPVKKKDIKFSRVPQLKDRLSVSSKGFGENGNVVSSRSEMKRKDCNLKPGWLKMETAFKTEDSSDQSSENVMDFFSACANI